MCEEENEFKERMTKRMFDFKNFLIIIFLHVFLIWCESPTSNNVLFCVLYFAFLVSIVIVCFFPSFFSSPLLSFVFQGQSMEFLHWPFVWKMIMTRRKQIRQEEKDDSFDVRESEREEQSICLWCLDEAFQKSKWESVSGIHSDILWRHLQTMQDLEARWKLLTWLTISRFEFVGLI